MVSFSKNKVLSAAVFASVLLLDNNNSAFNNNLCSKNAKGLNLNKRLLHETQAHVDDAHHAHHVADAHHAHHDNII
ncbi:histidine-rich protein PFHRP-II [Plasmodium falciparum MaliPS096_E11]|uniref:Histidine-rich protein PFHRP-II n=1 Tax=Plasmodium falciparum MaliPS096_E11 TaxID=1036727 RepID=A0A024WRY2_PLAFA|nr:histidine-rich protein PFHRP-II [Plasmodium falciparum MaliPS096_E11]